MHITVKFLETEVFPYVRYTGGINHKNAYNNINRYYCGPMTTSDLCPHNCHNCKYTLRYALNCDQANNPGGLMVWKLKDKVSRVRNAAMYEKEARAANIQPVMNDQNVFEQLSDQIDQEIQYRGS